MLDRCREQRKKQTQMRWSEDPRRSRSVVGWHCRTGRDRLCADTEQAACAFPFSPSPTIPSYPQHHQDGGIERRITKVTVVLATPWTRGSTPWHPDGCVSTASNAGSVRQHRRHCHSFYADYTSFFLTQAQSQHKLIPAQPRKTEHPSPHRTVRYAAVPKDT